MNYRLIASWMLVATIAFSGCGPSGRQKVKTAEVSGTVKFNGQPLDGAQVNFLGAEFAGVATTDSSGQYTLDAQPGENKIYIRKFEGAGPGFDETMMDSAGDTPGSGPKQIVPEKYSDPSNTELKFTVPDEGSTDASFDLTG